MPDEFEDLNIDIFDDESVPETPAETSPAEPEVEPLPEPAPEPEPVEEVEDDIRAADSEPPADNRVAPPLPHDVETPTERLLGMATGERVRAVAEATPKMKDVIDSGFPEEMDIAHEIINRYVEYGVQANRGTIEDDIIMLSAILVRIAGPVGYATGLAKGAENIRRMAVSDIHTELRILREREGVGISNKDAEHAARALSSAYIIEHERTEMADAIFTNTWYGLQTFIRALESMKAKISGEDHADRVVQERANFNTNPTTTPRATIEPTPEGLGTEI